MQTSPNRPSANDLRRLVGSVNQLRFNDNKGEVSFFGQKMIILRRDFFRVMREGLERLVGDQAAPFLSYLASGVGVHEGSIFRDSVQSEGEERKATLENLVHAAFEDTNLGLGKIRVGKVNFDNGTAGVVVANCFEALENGSAEGPNCMFTGGFLAGLFAEIFDKTVLAREVRCISKGDSECEFRISQAENGEPVEAPLKEEVKVKTAGKSESLEKSISGKLASENEEMKAAAESRTVGEQPATESTTKVETRKGSAAGSEKSAPVKDVSQATESKLTLASKPVAGESSETKTKVEPKVATSGQGDFDSGVERASRIAKRKKGFWDRLFK